jgi:hypothetical protein
MFVWAMRDKGSEWKAVKNFLQAGALPFTPLVEAVCEPFMAPYGSPVKSPVRVIADLASKIVPMTASGRIWVDLDNLRRIFSDNDVAELYRIALGHFGSVSALVTPVVRTSSPPEILDVAFAWSRGSGCGVCIRVEGSPHLSTKAAAVRSIAAGSGEHPTDIDLIYDAQDLPRAVSHDALRDYLPLSAHARTWVVLAGTFPPMITDMKADEYEHKRERGEWAAWCEEISDDEGDRLPLYGDYATQPAIYMPSPPFPGSPSVRYTTAEQFVVLRGRGGYGDRGADYGQYIGHAIYLRDQPYYCDVVPTPGDAYVDRIATRTHGTGNATTWRIASLERHLHVVATQVARFAPAAFGPRS